MKKFVTLLLAMVMIFSLATAAFAATNDSITINNAKAGETYKIYKMLDLSVNSEETPTAYTYTVNEDWADFVFLQFSQVPSLSFKNSFSP